MKRHGPPICGGLHHATIVSVSFVSFCVSVVSLKHFTEMIKIVFLCIFHTHKQTYILLYIFLYAHMQQIVFASCLVERRLSPVCAINLSHQLPILILSSTITINDSGSTIQSWKEGSVSLCWVKTYWRQMESCYTFLLSVRKSCYLSSLLLELGVVKAQLLQKTAALTHQSWHAFKFSLHFTNL